MIIAIIALSLVCIGLVTERYLFAKTMLKQLDDCIKAAMSRNINEYLTATTINQGKKNTFVENDEVLLDDADEEQFDKFIRSQTQ